MKARLALSAVLFACFAAGALLDFLIYGVAKIIWAVIYVPLFAVAASVLHTKISNTRFSRNYKEAFLLFLAGALLGRGVLVNRHRSVLYQMLPSATQPLTLRSADWPRTLIVSSDQLIKELSGKPAGRELPVVVDVITNYGCISDFRVNSVDGVDVNQDPKAAWTWRAEPGKDSGPGREDQDLPWCRIQLYRTGTPSSKQ